MICESKSRLSVFRSIVKAKHLSVPRLRYPAPNLHCVDQTDNGLFSQYYGLATGTVLFYDYFLTLEDEVRRDFSLGGVRIYLDTTFRRSNMPGLERSHGVRVSFGWIHPLLNILVAFWLFLVVSLARSP